MHIRKKKSIAKVGDGDRGLEVELKVLKRVYDWWWEEEIDWGWFPLCLAWKYSLTDIYVWRYYFNNAMRLDGDIMSRGKEVKELREKMKMNRREFSDYYGIPYRTVQDWEAEKRELPEYLLRLMKYRAEIEYMVKNES